MRDFCRLRKGVSLYAVFGTSLLVRKARRSQAILCSFYCNMFFIFDPENTEMRLALRDTEVTKHSKSMADEDLGLVRFIYAFSWS